MISSLSTNGDASAPARRAEFTLARAADSLCLGPSTNIPRGGPCHQSTKEHRAEDSLAASLPAPRRCWLADRVSARAETAFAPGEEWLAKIHGKHRQVVDCTGHNNGFGIAYALNFIDTTKQALSLPESEFTSVVSYRHMAMPLMLNDAMWSKYHVGELLGVNDPKTNAPATRNIFHDNVLGRPGLTYEQAMTTRPLIMTACNAAWAS